MIKNLLFVASIFSIGFCSAQSFQLLDHNDVDITNTTHYEYGTPATIALTKFHVKNLTNSQQNFALRVIREYVPYTNSSLACCFGTACFSASATVDGTQIINSGVGDVVAANDIYTDLKVSPVTWMWNSPSTDHAIWRVTVFDQNNPADSASALVVYADASSTVSLDEINSDEVKLNAFPNPATNNLTINYSVNGDFNRANVEMYDVLGQKLISEDLTTSNGQVKLNVSNLNAGVYFYSIRVNGQAIKTERVIVQ